MLVGREHISKSSKARLPNFKICYGRNLGVVKLIPGFDLSDTSSVVISVS